MTTATVLKMLTDLRAGPYQRRGGHAALAHDLGVTPLALTNWQGGKSEPTHRHYLVILALWERHQGEAQE